MPEMNREEIAKLEALYASNPEGRVFTHLAEAYRKAGEFERARNILEQGLTRHPAYASAHVVLGRVYADLNDSEQATASFRHVLELDPHNLVALRSLGDLARARGRADEALDYFQELRHQDPSNNDIEGIIDELKRAPAPVELGTSSFEEVAVPGLDGQAEPEARAEPEAGAEPETVEPTGETADAFETLPGFEDATPDYGDLVSPDIDLGWSEPQVAEEALPGDLAEFATLGADSPAPEAVPPERAEPEAAAFEPEAAAFEPEPPVDTPIDLSDFENLEESPAFTSTEDPWSMTMDPAAAAVEDEADDAPIFEEPAYEELVEFESVTYGAYVIEEPAETPELPSFDVAEETADQPAAESFQEPVSEPFEEPLEEPVDELEPLPTWEAAAEPEPEPEPTADLPLMTETMAELYTEQGLYDKAATVYRSLMAERPWDPDLPIRMADVEAKARGESTAVPDVEEEVESPWTSAQTSTASVPSPYAWTEERPADTGEEGPPISGYFQALLSWRPAGAALAHAPVTPEAAAEPEPEVANFEPTAESENQPAIIELDTPVSGPMDAEPTVPWATPSAPAPQAAPPVAAPPSDNPVEAAFDEWFNASDFGEDASAGAESDGPAPAGAEASSQPEDDDDLEMFRSWLQSLKK